MNLEPVEKEKENEIEYDAETEPELFDEKKLFNRDMKYDSQLISQQKNYLDEEVNYSDLVK